MSQVKDAKNRWQLAYRVLLVIVAIYALVGVVLIPLFAKQQAVSFLEQRLGGSAQIDTITLNPFSFSLGVSGMRLDDLDARPLLSFDSLSLNFQPTSFLFGELAFSEIAIDGLHASLRRHADGSNNIDELLQRWSTSAPEQVVDDTPSQNDGLIVRIDALRVTGASLGLADEAVSPAFQTLIESIDFSLDDLSTSLGVTAQQRLTLAIGEGSQLHWVGTLGVAPMQSAGELHIFGPLPNLAYRYFQEQIPVVLDGGWFDTSLRYDFALSETGEPDLRVQELEMALTNLDVRDRQTNDLLVRLPTLSMQGGSLDLLQRQVSVTQVLLDRVRIDAERSVDGVLNLQAAFASDAQEELTPTQTQSDGEQAFPWTVQLSALDLQGWEVRVRDLQPNQPLSVDVGLDASASNISNLSNQAIAVETSVTLSSGGRLDVGGDLTVLPALGFAGQLDLATLALPVLQPYLADLARVQLATGTLSVAGNVEASAEQSQFSGNASLDTLLIRDTVQNEDLFSLASLGFEDTRIAIGEMNQINIEAINVQAPYARIEIEEDGSNNIGRVLVETSAQADSSESQAANIEAESANELPEIGIEQIRLAQGSADFSDRSLPLPFAVRIDALGGEVSTLSSSSREPARLNLEGQVDEYGLASISGRLRPLDYAALTEIDLAFRNLNIPSLSPYAIKFAGRKIANGALDVDLVYRINEGQLNGENAMIMRDLELGERVEHPDAIDLPLGLAIALLKDGNGVIDLDVPVTGNLDSPQFNYGNVIRTALGNIIRNIVASPFKFLANLVGADDESDIGVIEFVPGRSDLQPPQREKLAQLAEAFLQRPQLQLDLKGRYASEADSEVLKEQFFDERFEKALEQLVSDIEPMLKRVQLLEQFSMLQAPEDNNVELELLALRQEFTSVNAGGQQQFDALAYSQALRRKLISQEQVSVAALELLASKRVEAIYTELSAHDPNLASRVQTMQAYEDVQLLGTNIPFELELSSL